MAAEETVTVGIDMVDGVSVPAQSAAAALGKLQDSIKADTKALAEMQRAMTQLKKATTPDTEQIKRLEKSMGTLKDRIAKSRNEFIGMGGQFGRNYKGAKDFKGKLDELANAASILPGPLGGVLSLLQRLAGAKSLARVAAVALAGAIVAIGIATVVAGKSLADFAIKAQEARRSELLMLEASTKLRTATALAFGLSADKATDLQKAVDEVAGSVSIGRDKVAAYAAQLERMGVRGAKIKPALEAVSIAASGFGEEQANNTAAWAASLALTGGNINKLAQRVKNQIGGVVAKQMLSSEVQARKLAESYNALFGGIDIEPLLRAKKSFNDLFSQATASGQTLRRFLGYLVQPLVNGLEQLSRLFKIFVQEAIIGLLLAENAWLRFQIALDQGITAFKEKFPNAVKAVQAVGTVIEELWRLVKDVFGSEWKELLGAAAAVLVVTVAPAIWAAATAMWGFAAGVLAATWPVLATIAGVWLLIKAFEYLYDFMESEDLGALVANIFSGLLNGVKRWGGIWVDAFVGIGKAAIAGFKSIFKMQSPSKVMAELGVNIVKGLEQGVDKEGAKAEDAIAGMAGEPIPVPNMANLRTATAGGGGGSTINIAALNVQVGAGASKGEAKSIAEAIKRELESILETVTVQMGAPVP
jgi:hypothetical protein